MSEQNTIRRLGKMNHTINELAASFAEREGVEALVLAGSAATGLADEESDYDLYAYTREAVPIEFRANLLKPRAARLELHNIFWEWSDEWVEPDGTPFDLMYRSCDAIEADVEARLGRGLGSLGYSTSLCHSVLHAKPVFDRRGWFQALQDRLKSTAYPDRLVEGVVKLNLPVLGSIIHSYEQQIRSAFRRRDRVSLNHRTGAWLASYFDILFAANRRFNPGEKRLLAHAQALPATPERMVADVEAACMGACSLESCVADHLEAMRARLESCLQEQGLLSPR
jgi:predicted nucleotidyltransferase